jgi:small neutral amino acid transporter SnatA (MarC family)
MDTEEDHALIARQISMLRKRILLTKRMQAFGVLSFFVCTMSMFLLFLKIELAGAVAFGISLILLSLSLLYSLYEIVISTNAINVELESFESRKQGKSGRQG